MSELLEMVDVAAGADDDKCPFPHYEIEQPPDNYWPNESTTLKSNLADPENDVELYLPHKEATTIGTGPTGRKNYTMTYNAHHLLPGEASWPHTALKKWMDTEAEGSKVRFDIGYDVNCHENGLDLPSSDAMEGNWTTSGAGRTENFQRRYAFAAIRVTRPIRQFHDSHEAYSEFAIKVLDKIAAVLDARHHAGDAGCGEDDCPGKQGEKYPPPIETVPFRVRGACQRLASALSGSAENWNKPVFTSKFALMYKNRKLTQAAARQQLSPDQFDYDED